MVEEVIVEANQKGVKCGGIEMEESGGRVRVGEIGRVVVVDGKRVELEGVKGEELQIDVDMMSSENVSSKARISIFAETSPPTLLMSSQIQDIKETKVFNLILTKQQLSKFSNNTIYLQIDSSNHTLLGSISPLSTPTHIIQLLEVSFFNITQNETIKYKVYQTEENMLVNITSTCLGNLTISAGNKTTNESSLTFKCQNKSCEFTIKSTSNHTIGYIQLLSHTIQQHSISYTPLTTSLHLKLHSDQTRYLLLTRPPAKQLFFIHVSSPNIIIYIGGELCPQPSSTCHDYSGSDMSQIAIETEQTTLYIALQALETAQFVIRVENGSGKYVELKDAIPVRIQFKEDKEILFSYKVEQIETVYFNLLGTPGMFTMYVENSKQTPDQYSLYKSNSFIRIPKQDIISKQFTILVKRIGFEINEKITLIASTSQSIITIDKNSPYYDNFSPSEKKYYLLLLNIDQTKISISFQISPLLPHYNLTLRLGPRKDYLMHNLTILSSFSSLNLDDNIKKICDQQDSDEFCEVYVEVENEGEKEVDTTFTMMVGEGVMELKAGVWQKYEIGEVEKVNRFYFVPKGKRSLFVELDNVFMNYRLEYNVWNNSKKELNKELWPFTTTTPSTNHPNHTLTISPSQLSSCFPTCLILLSVINAVNVPFTLPFMRFAGTFGIMISDSVTQLNQGQKSTVQLSVNESKFFVVDLKQYIKDEDIVLTFTMNRVIGFYNVVGKVAGDEYDPPTMGDHQYTFNSVYTQIKISDLVNSHPDGKQLIIMATSTSISLTPTPQSPQHSIFSFLYTTTTSLIHQLPLSQLTSLKLQPRTSQIYKIDFWKQFRIKILRKQGFPLISYAQCKREQMDKCLKDLEKREIEIVSKVDEIRGKSEGNGGEVMLVKVGSKNQEVVLDLLAVAQGMSVRLGEGNPFLDFGEKDEQNLYTITAFRTKQTKIFITVYQGSPLATLTSPIDSLSLNSTSTNNLITFTLLPSMFKSPQWVFANLELSLKDTNMNCSYSILYTVYNNVELRDGLITAGSIKEKQNITYVYSNGKVNDRMVVSLSFKDSEMMKKCKIEILQSGDELSKIEPRIQHIESNTPNPTLVFELDQNYTTYEILLKNEGDKGEISYNVSVNYVDIVLLPLGYEYPMLLKQGEGKNLIVEIENEAIVEFKVKKCNSQDLLFSYTQDKEEFKSGEYTNEIEVEQLIQTSKVHVKPSTLFIKVFSKTGVLLVIRVKVLSKDQRDVNVKAGNQGVVEYLIREQQKADIQFTPVVCHDKCPKPIKYEYVLGEKLEDVEAQTVCQSSFFLANNQTVLKSSIIDQKKSQELGKVVSSIQIKQDMQYLGVRAVLPDGQQIPYQIIQLSTVWGQIQKHTNRHFLPFSITLVFLFCCCFIGLRFQNRRKGRYEPLPQ